MESEVFEPAYSSSHFTDTRIDSDCSPAATGAASRASLFAMDITRSARMARFRAVKRSR